jgi:guanylate kinase
MSRAARGLLVVLSGPSGVGKSSVAERLLCEPNFDRAVTATTRPPRPGEKHGSDYFFVTKDAFEQALDAGKLLEHAQVHAHLYGTLRHEVETRLAGGKNVLLVIDVQGAATLRQKGVAALYVFLAPPSWEELERRLRSRATDSEAQVRTRLATAHNELARQREFDTVVINDDLDHAVGEISRLVQARRQ